jgi:RNA polymerase sigma-70 factor (ECF subfamily)
MIARVKLTGGGSGDDIDPQIVQDAIWGSRPAFEALVRHYHGPLRSFAYRLAGEDVDDVLQEAYIGVFRGLPDFDPRGAGMAAWLYRIVYNAAIDAARQRSRRASAMSRLVREPNRVEDGPEPAAMSDAGLAQLLGTLPMELRALALLVDAFGFSYQDAAEVLDIAPGTVASRLHRARKTLRMSREYAEVEEGE